MLTTWLTVVLVMVQGYQQLEDGSWLSPEAYESIKRQSRRSLCWDIRVLLNIWC
ncbi:hypothetical protein H6G27_32200 [Nostoc linckia FACHB-104]|nr:hypothetical protein [Nostoc linckia FACHB-104]